MSRHSKQKIRYYRRTRKLITEYTIKNKNNSLSPNFSILIVTVVIKEKIK